MILRLALGPPDRASRSRFCRGGGVHWHTDAFEVHGKFCIMGYFALTPGTAGYSAFVWDPARAPGTKRHFPCRRSSVLSVATLMAISLLRPPSIGAEHSL